MAGTREIKSRIKSVQSTHQITKAMEVVSTTKFKKLSAQVLKSRAYSDSIDEILKNISSGIKAERHPLFDGRKEVKRIGVIIMTSDRGLCGSFNANTMRKFEEIKEKNSGKDISVIALGKKGRDYCLKRNYSVKAEYIQIIPEVIFEKAKEISENIVEYYNAELFDEVYIIYNKFISALRSDLLVKKVIPIERVDSESNIPYIFEPDVETVLSDLLPKYLNIELYQAMLDNMASEHSARKNSMKNANDNAEEMLKELNLQYNRERQAAITQEISEIVGGASALK